MELEADRWVSRWMDDRRRGRRVKVDNRCSYLRGQVEEDVGSQKDGRLSQKGELRKVSIYQCG